MGVNAHEQIIGEQYRRWRSSGALGSSRAEPRERLPAMECISRGASLPPPRSARTIGRYWDRYRTGPGTGTG